MSNTDLMQSVSVAQELGVNIAASVAGADETAVQQSVLVQQLQASLSELQVVAFATTPGVIPAVNEDTMRRVVEVVTNLRDHLDVVVTTQVAVQQPVENATERAEEAMEEARGVQLKASFNEPAEAGIFKETEQYESTAGKTVEVVTDAAISAADQVNVKSFTPNILEKNGNVDVISLLKDHTVLETMDALPISTEFAKVTIETVSKDVEEAETENAVVCKASELGYLALKKDITETVSKFPDTNAQDDRPAISFGNIIFY